MKLVLQLTCEENKALIKESGAASYAEYKLWLKKHFNLPMNFKTERINDEGKVLWFCPELDEIEV